MNTQMTSQQKTTKHLGAFVDTTVFRALRLQAAHENRSMSRVIEDALKQYLAAAPN